MQRRFSLPEPGSKILLINSHAYDIRLPWWQYHQPTGLLKLGSLLKKRGCDVRLIDCMHWQKSRTITRRKLGSVTIDDYEFDIWRFGALWGHLTDYIRELKSSGFEPNYVYVSCFQTTWWEAARDLISYIKEKWFRKAVVVLGGIYPMLEPEHAENRTDADIISSAPIVEAKTENPDFSLYDADHRPTFAGLDLWITQGNRRLIRNPDEIVKEIAEKSNLGVTEFAFFDDLAHSKDLPHFQNVLKSITSHKLDVRFVALGNISPSLIDGETARLMGAAGYKQVYLRCDVKYSANGAEYVGTYQEYKECIKALTTNANLRSRTGEVTALLMVGNPYEDIKLVTERLVKLSSIVGAVSLVQYQHTRGTRAGKLFQALVDDSGLDLAQLNCKLFPFARLTQNSLQDYLELTRLAALLNSKYRSRTFDFLGEGLVSKAIQESIAAQSWQPRLNGKNKIEQVEIPLASIRWDEEENSDHQE